MRLQLALQGSLAEVMRAEASAVAKAEERALRRVGKDTQRAIRAHVRARGLGKLGYVMKFRFFAAKGNKAAAAFVYPESRYWAEILDAWDQGVTITGKNGGWLAIPTPAARKFGFGRGGNSGRGKRRRGANIETAFQRYGGLRYVQVRWNRAVLVADNTTRSGRAKKGRTTKDGAAYSSLAGRTDTVMFVLVRQVRITKKIDLDLVVRSMGDDLTRVFLEELEKADG